MPFIFNPFSNTLDYYRTGGGGGGGGSNVSIEIPTGTINGTNTTFTAVNQPFEVIVDNQSFLVAASALNGLSVTGTGPYTITTPFAPNSWIGDLYNIAGAIATWIQDELVAGSNITFTLINTPASGSAHVFGQRVRLYPSQYSLLGSTITTSLSFSAGDILSDYFSGTGYSGYVDNEVVSGSSHTFTLAQAPSAGTVRVFGQGVRLKVNTDYTISGSTISTSVAFVAGDILADYNTVADAHNVSNEICAGSGTSWTLVNTPVGQIELYDPSGARLYPASADPIGGFTISGTNITTLLSYSSGSLIADYRI